MLKALRDNLKYLSWVLWIIIAAFVAAIFFDFGRVTGVGAPKDAAATVGGETITFAEYEQQYRSLERRYRDMFGDQFSSQLAQQLNLNRQAIEALINRKVLALEAHRLGLSVSDAEVRQAILDIPSFQQDGKFIGQARYAQLLQSNGYTTDRFEQELRDDLLLQKMQQIMAQNVYLSPSDVEEAYRHEVERAAIRYVQLPQTRFTAEAKAGREEMQAYLEAHPDQFRQPEQRKAAYLLVDTNRLRDAATVPEQELRSYYDQHTDEFSRPEQVRARHILLRTGGERSAEEARRELADLRGRIAGGEDFAAVARKVSEDPGSAAKGGDLGFFGRGQMVPQFEQAAFGAKVGELVGPVETPFGVHLLEVTDRREAGQRSFEEARDEIARKLAGEKSAEQARQRAADLAAQLRKGEGGVEAMRQLAEGDDAVSFAETQPFARQGIVPGVGRVPAFSDAAFALAEGAVSDPVQVPRGWAVLEVEESLPARQPELSEVEAHVRRAVEQEKRQQLARQRLEKASREMADGKTLEEVAAELGVDVQESGEFGADGPVAGLGSVPEVAQQALTMDEGAVGGPVATPQGAVLFQVSERKRFEPAELAAHRDEVRERLAAQRSNLLEAALIQQRRDELGVTFSRQVADQIQKDNGAQG